MKIDQKVMHCPLCRRPTMHHRNNYELGFKENFGHGVLVALTCGLWLFVWFPWLIIATIWKGKWSCGVCGR